MIGALEISGEALRQNATALNAMVGGRSHQSFVVKSNAYGHGLLETARAIEPIAGTMCVYGVDEAVALRDGGISTPLIVLGPVTPEELDEAIAARVEFALWDVRDFARLVAAAARKRHTRARVHLKLNTGLNRLGLQPDELADAVEDYLQISDIEIAGVFSHLASAEEIDSPYTMHQLAEFERGYAQAQPAFAAHHLEPTRHVAASAAAILWPQTRLDMARIGIALYGLWPSPQTRLAAASSGLMLQPALRYTSSLVVIRTIAAGSSVGYGNTFHAPSDMRIGVVPLGYADGIPRALSNRGAFLVDGKRAPIVGRIAMNMTVLDLSAVPTAHVDSRVTLIGDDGVASVTADDWANWADTINYEIVTRLPSTLKRVSS